MPQFFKRLSNYRSNQKILADLKYAARPMVDIELLVSHAVSMVENQSIGIWQVRDVITNVPSIIKSFRENFGKYIVMGDFGKPYCCLQTFKQLYEFTIDGAWLFGCIDRKTAREIKSSIKTILVDPKNHDPRIIIKRSEIRPPYLLFDGANNQPIP